MAIVITNVEVLDDVAPFLSPLKFDITFECLQALQEDTDIDIKVIYVGSAEDPSKDQVLDEVSVGPVPIGLNKITLQCDPPNPALIPPEDLKDATVILICFSYREKEFVRIGYFVMNEIPGEEPAEPPADSAPMKDDVDIEAEGGMDTEGGEGMDTDAGDEAPDLVDVRQMAVVEVEKKPATPIDPTLLTRNILSSKPRVTRFSINWGDESAELTNTDTVVAECADLNGDSLSGFPNGNIPVAPMDGMNFDDL